MSGAKLTFTHDTSSALRTAAALVNTDVPGDDGLDDTVALDAFVATWTSAGPATVDQSDLDAVRALRPRLRALWTLDEDGVAAEINTMLREAGALPQLVAHDGWGYHLHATAPDASLADRMLVNAAMAFLDVVRQEELERLRLCEAEGCQGVLVDLSRNRSRRYCSTTCANRIHVAAFRARRGERS